MKKQYFTNVPNFDYGPVAPLNQSTSMTMFKQRTSSEELKMSEEIFGNHDFKKIIVRDGERPDVVAYRAYGNANLDWLVMLSNNIINYD